MTERLSRQRPEPLRPNDHVIGPDSAPVTVISYCDFECPYCGEAFLRTKRLRDRFYGQFRLVYRHFPLIDKHPLSQQAAEASEAAAGQGRFWVLHDLLFQHQEDLETDDLYRYAEAAGLDLPRFKADLHGRVHASRVLSDVKSGRRSGVTGTPTFFLNDAWLEDDNRLEDAIRRAA
ncbi:MAG TPA: thioredoxin domain-containing protein [Nitrospira sp.]|nr:thioredoxin domain-containing protein [Nitrospira sp.]